MDSLELAIQEGQEKVRRFEKELLQASELLRQAQEELNVLLEARQIVSRNRFLEHSSSDNLPLPIHGDPRDFPAWRKNLKKVLEQVRPRDMTIVAEIKAILSEASAPLGPSEIRAEMAKTGRDVPQNVMTGLLSRLTKEGRVERIERGKYRAVHQEAAIEQKETA